jgi:hypothetical protein
MSVEVEIKGQDGVVAVTVLGYENAEAENSSDANWLVCRVHVRVGAVRSDFRAAFTTHDFVAFASELGALLEGRAAVATFDTYEEALKVTVEMARKTGAARISGVARWDGSETAVSFTLDSDQSYLSSTVRSLDEVTRRFPVRRP